MWASHSDPLSVFYDARTVAPVSRNPGAMTGVGRYTLSLLRALATLPDAPRLRALFLPEAAVVAREDPKLSGVEILTSPVSHELHPAGDLWLHFVAAKRVGPGEIYHGPAFLIPPGTALLRRGAHSVVTIHDLMVFTHPECYPRGFGWWMRRRIAAACRDADHVIVPTQAVADEIARRFSAAQRASGGPSIHAIAEAPDSTDAPWDTVLNSQDFKRQSGPQARPNIISIGGFDARKDPRTAREALIALSRDVPAWWLWFGNPDVARDPSRAALIGGAENAGFVGIQGAPNESVRRTLDRAAAFVSCSRAEGFGITLTEAMAAGCPLVVSDIPAHREVAGDAALYFPPGDSAALANALRRVVTDNDFAADLRRRSRERAKEFSWAKAAAATLNVYRGATAREIRE